MHASQQPKFAEDLLKAFLMRLTITEQMTDQLAEMFSATELGLQLLRVIEDISRHVEVV